MAPACLVTGVVIHPRGRRDRAVGAPAGTVRRMGIAGGTVPTDPPGPSPCEPHITMTASLGGPALRSWREGTLTRAKELESLSNWVLCDHPHRHSGDLAKAIAQLLEAAREAATPRWRLGLPRPLIQRAMGNLDAAEAQLLNVAPARYLFGQMPSLLNHIQRHLVASDPRRQEFERIALEVGRRKRDDRVEATGGSQRPLDKLDFLEGERGKIVTAVRGASSAALREQLRVSSFRTVLVATTIVMFLIGVGIAVLGMVNQAVIPLCFTSEQDGRTMLVCPTAETALPPAGGSTARDIDGAVLQTAAGYDLLLVELIGMTAASVAAAGALRQIRGSSEPYGLPVALAALKLPTGAVTAVLGLLLMRGEFVPGLTALDTSAQIIAWAVVFGYAQQLFTRMVDQQAHTVLDRVRGANKQTERKRS